MHNLTPCLWFDGCAEEAVDFYLSVFPDSQITSIARYGESGAQVSGNQAGTVMTVAFQIDGRDFVALNGGPHFKFTPAVSFMVHCDTQEQLDELWEKLCEGGEPSQCGWLTDQFGISWQVVPSMLSELMAKGDAAASERMMAAILPMQKLDIETLKRAYAGE